MKRFWVVVGCAGTFMAVAILTALAVPREVGVAIDKVVQLLFAVAALVAYARQRNGWMTAAMASLTVGLSAWIFFATSVQSASRSLLDNANLIRKTRFPRQLVPLSVVATNLISFAVMLLVLLVLNFALLPRVRATEWLALPIAVAFVAITGGLALAIASLNVLFRDIEFLVAALLLPLFFLTPVLYPLTDQQIASRQWVVDLIHWANPLSPPIEALHAVLFYGNLPSAGDTIYTVVAALVALLLGASVFTAVDDEIAVEV